MIQLRPYQEPGLQRTLERNGLIQYFCDMRTGKSYLAARAMEELHPDHIAIVAPVSVTNVWTRMLRDFQHEFHEYEVVVLTRGEVDDRAATLRRLSTTSRVIAILAYPSYWRPLTAPDPTDPRRRRRVRVKNTGMEEAMLKHFKPQGMVYDEIHQLKDRTSDQSKFAHRIAEQPWSTYRLGLTGTPTGRSLESYFSLYKAIDRTVFGTRWIDFQNAYISIGGYMNKQIVGYRNVDDMSLRIQYTSFTITREQAGIREPDNVKIPITWTPKARKQYDELRKKGLAEVEGTNSLGDRKQAQVLPIITLTQLMRLQQMCDGFVNVSTDPARPDYIDISDDKLAVAVDLVRVLRDQGKRVTLYAAWLHSLDRLGKALGVPRTKQWRGDNDMSEAERDALIDDFEAERIPVLLCQEHAASMGQNFSAGDAAIYYSIGYSLVDFSQVYARILNDDPLHQPVNYHLQMEGPNSADEFTYDSLMDGQDIARLVSNLTYARRIFV